MVFYITFKLVPQWGGGKSSCTLSKMLVLTNVLVHETSLANQHFYSSYAFGGKDGICKRSILCTLVKMLKIMGGSLTQ